LDRKDTVWYFVQVLHLKKVLWILITHVQCPVQPVLPVQTKKFKVDVKTRQAAKEFVNLVRVLSALFCDDLSNFIRPSLKSWSHLLNIQIQKGKLTFWKHCCFSTQK